MKKSIFKDLPEVLASAIIIVVVGYIGTILAKKLFHVEEYIVNLTVLLIMLILVFLFRPLISWIKSFNQESIHTRFITSKILPPKTSSDTAQFDVDTMYKDLTGLLTNSASLKIVDNVTSNLDIIQNLKSRNVFHEAIENKLSQDANFVYERIEISFVTTDKLSTSDSRSTSAKETKNNLGIATKAHCEKVVNGGSNAYVGVLPFDKYVGTFLIFDRSVLCFQIDGIDLGMSQPSDLIVMKVDDPREQMLETYENRFKKLKELCYNYKLIN
ncbi:MAG TPA: hypothetical protein VK588_17030 [Chitinophagaceae bacterium]|nr:hypothetical protein [Chitinophagaceae bacterium]